MLFLRVQVHVTTVQHVYVLLCTFIAPVAISHLASPAPSPAPPPPIPAPLSPSWRLPGEVPGERPVAAVVPGEPPVVGVVVDVAPVDVAAAAGPVLAAGPVPVLGSSQLVLVRSSAAVSSSPS